MLAIGNLVDVTGRTLTHYGELKELLPNKEARIRFKTPRHPKVRGVCDSCKGPGFLSVNGGTGEVVCMRSRCGHEYGFEERDEIVPVANLINITEKRLDEKKAAFKRDLGALLQRGTDEKLITPSQRISILNLF